MRYTDYDVEKFDTQYEKMPKESWKYVECVAYKALYNLVSDLKNGDYLIEDTPFVKRNSDIIPSKRKRSGNSVEHMKLLRNNILKLVKNNEITINQASLITKKFGFYINSLKTFTKNNKKNITYDESDLEELINNIPKKYLKQYKKENSEN